MGGILGACNAISDYLHTLNMGSTLFRLILAMFLGCLIGIDRGMKKRVAGVKTHMIVCPKGMAPPVNLPLRAFSVMPRITFSDRSAE